MAPNNSIQSLSIYKEHKVEDHVESKSFVQDSNPRKSPGVFSMMLLNDIKERYRNTVSAIHNFKAYAVSTEGRVKFSVIFLSFASGCALSYRSTSKRLWFKKLIPVVTTTLGASVCYPYGAWNVGKNVSHRIAGTYKGSKVVASYTYGKIKVLTNKLTETKVVTDESKEASYVMNEDGSVNQSEASKNEIELVSKADKSIKKNATNSENTTELPTKSEDNIKMFTTGFSSAVNNDKKADTKSDVLTTLTLPSRIENNILNSLPKGDSGQGSSEDADLYTTRS